jgi:DNA-binding transcriptional LysR family regulator
MVAPTAFFVLLMTVFDPAGVLRRLTARLRIRHLSLLLQIERHGSLTRAADAMASSQPAVTQTLAEMEELFGTPLFERSARGMTPTPLGRLAIGYARSMTEDLGRLVGSMEAVIGGHGTHVHLGIVPFVPSRLIAMAVAHARANGEPDMSVTLHEDTSEQLLAGLQEHTLDLVIGRSSPVDPAVLSMQTLYRQAPRLVAGRRLAARLARVPLDWARLAGLDWILGAPQTPMREQVAAIFLCAGIAPPVPMAESYSSRLIGEFVASGEHCVSIVPADIAEEIMHVAGVAVVPYTFDWGLPPLAVFTRAASSPRPADGLLIRSLRAVVPSAHAPGT